MRFIFLLFPLPLLVFCHSIHSKAIYKIIESYTRPITFLGIMPYNDELIKPLLNREDIVFVLIDPNTIEFQENPPSNFIHLKFDPSIHDLSQLSECEHFDIVYIETPITAVKNLNLTTNYGKTLAYMGEHVFINPKESSRQTFLKFGFKPVENINKNHQLYYSYKKKDFLLRTNWLEESSIKNNVRHIESTYNVKKIHKNYGETPTTSIWKPGINLLTFKILNGVYPSADQLKSEIQRIFEIPHPDRMPNNIIVQGSHLNLIDFEDPYMSAPRTVQTIEMLNLLTLFANEPRKEKILEILDKVLKYNQLQIHPSNEKD